MDDARLVLDYIDVLAWPTVVIVTFGVVIARFRKEIVSALNRISSVKGPLNTELTLREQGEAESEPPQAPTPEPADGEAAEADAGEFERMAAELKRAETDLWYERVHRFIFGTQIMLLQDLNQRTGGLITTAIMTSYYQQHLIAARTTDPNYQLDFTAYMQFLTGWGLVQYESGAYRITQLGRGYLTYLAAQGIPTGKFL